VGHGEHGVTREETLTAVSRSASLLMLLIGCGGGGEKLQPTHRGVYSGGQLRMFVLCGESKMLDLAGKAQSSIETRHADMVSQPNQPVYLEVRGEVLPPPEGAGEDQRGSIRVDTVLSIARKVPSTCALASGELTP
jgi:hypothetical protein